MTAGELRKLLPEIRTVDKPLANAIATALVGRLDDEEIPMNEEARAAFERARGAA